MGAGPSGGLQEGGEWLDLWIIWRKGEAQEEARRAPGLWSQMLESGNVEEMVCD